MLPNGEDDEVAGRGGKVGYPPRMLVRCDRASLEDEAMGPSGMARRVVVGRKDEVEERVGEGGPDMSERDVLKSIR